MESAKAPGQQTTLTSRLIEGPLGAGHAQCLENEGPLTLGRCATVRNSSGPRIPEEEWPLGGDAGKWGRGRPKWRDWLSKGSEAEEYSHERKKVRKSVWRSIMLEKR